MSRRGTLFVVSAPSGTGKDTVVRELLARHPELGVSVSATTRKPRPGEQEGVDYYFVSPERFSEMIEKNEFLEYAEYTSASYGTPAAPVDEALDSGRDMILVIEMTGARWVQVKRPDAVLIFLVPPSFEELERRLRGRGTETEEQIEARMKKARTEVAQMGGYDYIVINDELSDAVADVEAIVRAERLKANKSLETVKGGLK